MSGSTTELNLSTAVDADDNADYLTISLANSLRTVDGLFNNLTGHTHGGAHQGGPVSVGTGSITDGSVTLAKLAANSVDSSKIVDASIATADLANGSVTAVKLASDAVGRENLLVNGGFELWSRGNIAFTANGGYCADRWMVNLNGTDTVNATRAPVTGGQNPSSTYGVVCNYVRGTGPQSGLVQTIKTVEQPSQLTTYSLSVRVLATVANGVTVSLVSDGTGPMSATSAFHPGDGAWRTLTATGTLPGNATFFNVSLNMLVTGTYYFDNVMLVVGGVPADFAPLQTADDVARANRHYQRWPNLNGAPRATGVANGTGRALVMMPLKTVMGGTPTLTQSAWGDFTIMTGAQAVAVSVQNGVYQSENHIGFDVNTVTSPLTVGHGVVMTCTNGTGWMVAEWNP